MKIQDFSDMFIPRHSAWESEEVEKVDGLTKVLVVLFIVFFIGLVIIGNHFGFNTHPY